MLHGRDYYMIALECHKVYLKSQTGYYKTKGQLFRETMQYLAAAFKKANPYFEPARFMDVIKNGDTATPKH